jgi:CDP-glucose 4,6-dehydratase
MVRLSTLRPYFEGKKVFLTGHTGFKGTWFLQILSLMGAKVKGYSLPPEKSHDLFYQVDGQQLCEDNVLHDLRDADRVCEEILSFQPDYLFHMAAQPLVVEGYRQPLYTFEVNGQGTANVLEGLRKLNEPCVAVMITTDKVYENKDEGKLFREDDKLGGYDPYSASKAVAEIIISSYRSSFFHPDQYENHRKSIASVRAGNVIGGGDFADSRIIPDIIKAIQKDEMLSLRYPEATRPWQHVLEPLGAYLLLASRMSDDPVQFATTFNLGPEAHDEISVEELTKIAIRCAGRGSYQIEAHPEQLHEASKLMLDISKAKNMLGWQPTFSAETAIRKTVEWYLDESPADMKCLQQINDYFENTINNADDE